MLTWEARHAEPLTKFLARTVCIDFSDDDLVFDVCKCISKLLIFRSEILFHSHERKEVVKLAKGVG